MRNISDKYLSRREVREVLEDQAVPVVHLDHPVRVVPWGLSDQVDQLRRLFLHLRLDREDLEDQHRRRLRARQARWVDFELVRRRLREVHRYRLVLVVRAGRVVRVVRVERQCLDGRELLDRRDLQVGREDRVDLVDRVDTVCTELALQLRKAPEVVHQVILEDLARRACQVCLVYQVCLPDQVDPVSNIRRKHRRRPDRKPDRVQVLVLVRRRSFAYVSCWTPLRAVRILVD